MIHPYSAEHIVATLRVWSRKKEEGKRYHILLYNVMRKILRLWWRCVVTLVMSGRSVVWYGWMSHAFHGTLTRRQTSDDARIVADWIACRLGVLPQCASFRAVAMSCVHTTGSPGEEKIYAFVMISYAIASLFMIVIMSGINGRINLFCCFCFVNF